jgi:hypothetical protein
MQLNNPVFRSILISAVVVSCVSSKFSNKRKGENLEVKVLEDANYLQLSSLRYQNIPDFKSAGGRGADGMLGQLTSLAILGVNKLIEIDKSQFTAHYSQSASELYFYNQLSELGHFDPSGLQFKGLELKRTVKIKGKDTLAFFASFEIDKSNAYEILNSSVFRLKVKELKLNFSKAKASDTRWYVPWSWGNKNLDDKMNMDIEIGFYTSYVTESGLLNNNVQIGKFSLNLRDMPLNPKAVNAQTYYALLAGKSLTGFGFIVPRSCGYSADGATSLRKIYNQGNYNIVVDVKETGKEKYIKTVLADNATQIIKEGSKEAIKLINNK